LLRAWTGVPFPRDKSRGTICNASPPFGRADREVGRCSPFAVGSSGEQRGRVNAPDHVHALVCYPPRVSSPRSLTSSGEHRVERSISPCPRRRGSSGRSATGPSPSLQLRSSRSSPTSEDSEGRSHPRRGLGKQATAERDQPARRAGLRERSCPGIYPGGNDSGPGLQQPGSFLDTS